MPRPRRPRRAKRADCPCGSGASYADCCAPLHRGDALAPTAEALMRSRYSAFALGKVAYLLDTYQRDAALTGDARDAAARSLRDHCRAVRYTRLEVLFARDGATADTAQVAFVAHYTPAAGGPPGALGELSDFVRTDGRWLYTEGVQFAPDSPPEP